MYGRTRYSDNIPDEIHYLRWGHPLMYHPKSGYRHMYAEFYISRVWSSSNNPKKILRNTNIFQGFQLDSRPRLDSAFF